MLDLMTQISLLKRPPLLVRAARFALDGYDRHRQLAQILGEGTTARGGKAIVLLLEIEAELEADRKAHKAEYTALRHIDVLTALIAEARTLRDARGT